MKISLVQLCPITGNIEQNISDHIKWINEAASAHSNLVIFPELSLTGYEPTLAKELAISKDDARLRNFQELSDEKCISIAVGAPLKNHKGITISLLLFHPHQHVQVYSKQYLHEDEVPFFIPEKNQHPLVNNFPIGLAICYEISVAEHIGNVMAKRPTFLLSSVSKDQRGVTNAYHELSDIAIKNKLPVAMVNCVGDADGMRCAGQSAFWDHNGNLIKQLDSTSEAILPLEL